MGEVLSQSEIHNLLKALSSGELDVDEMKNTEEKQVKNYDFARPSKFSKEHLRTLEIIFEHFGRLLSTNLPAYLRKTVNVEVVNSEVVIYSEFSNALSNPVLLGVVGMQPLSGNIIMEMASNLGFAIVDFLEVQVMLWIKREIFQKLNLQFWNVSLQCVLISCRNHGKML